MKRITESRIHNFREYLIHEEKSKATVEKYVRDVTAFAAWLGSAALNKMKVLKYKEYLLDTYAPSSVNSVLSSLNGFFDFCETGAFKVKTLKIQRRIFLRKEKELTKAESGNSLKPFVKPPASIRKRSFRIICGTCLPEPIIICARISCGLPISSAILRSIPPGSIPWTAAKCVGNKYKNSDFCGVEGIKKPHNQNYVVEIKFIPKLTENIITSKIQFVNKFWQKSVNCHIIRIMW